ncbi:MICAL 2 [Labeo rohita]|uniref:MICAL 2 n=1 Tax=Labeo rohita TaxID=84645 RepID=A0A498MGI6_LABRO|nr:MICAL 2 [Labeo rohita]
MVCTVHQHGQNGFKPTVKPFKSSGFTLADLVPKSDCGDEPSSQRYTSVLSAPIKAVTRPVELSPAPKSWTASAQRTQEARQKFFQSCGPAAEHRPTTRQQSGPSESCTNQNTSPKMQKNRTSALTNGKLHEGNTNNNNALSSDPGAQRQLKIRCTSAEVSSRRQELHGREVTGRSAYQATSASPAISSSGMNTKESLYLSAISKEHSKPPSLLLSTAKAKDVQSCEAPTDWRSKPKAAPNGPRFNHSVLLSRVWERPVMGRVLNVTVPCPHVSCPLSPVTNLHLQNNLAAGRRHQMKPYYITPDQISKELQDIENKLNDLENEGVELEWKLRVYEEEGHGDLLMDPLMVDWFNLIRKKQSYIRRESELMYIAKTQDLEEQQPGVEGELRRLINKPEHLKNVDEKKRETELLNKLMKIVNDRNAIVEGLEEDRIREEEEDQQLNEMMQRLGLQKFKNKRKSSFSKLFRRRSKKASMGE